MRRLMLATIIASLLAGCGSSPTAVRPTASRLAPTASQTAQATGGPSVSVLPSVRVAPATVVASQNAASDLVTADAHIDSIELLIQDGGAYYKLDGWFSDLVTKVKNAWTRWKLSRQVKAALKSSHDKAFELHEDDILVIKKNRTAPVTKINTLDNGDQEIVQTWTETDDGTFQVETRREVDSDGVTQVLTVSNKGTDKKGTSVDAQRIRTLMGEDGTYKVATKRTTTLKNGSTTQEEWLKVVKADGSETLTGFIIHPDGYRTDISGTRDAKGKVHVDVTSIAPAAKGS